MKIEIRTPDIGDVDGLTISKWVKNSGDIVEKDEVIAEVESDKALITLNAQDSGVLEIKSDVGYAKKGQLIATIDDSIKPDKKHPNIISPNDIVGRL